MVDNALASGSVVLTANADQMVKGLKEAEAKAEQSFHKTESKLNKASQKFMKKEGGFLGAVGGGLAADFGFGGAAMGVTAVILGAQQVVHVLGDWISSAKEFEAQMKKNEEATGKLFDMLTRMSKLREEEGGHLSGAERAETLKADIEEREKLLKKLTKDLHMATHPEETFSAAILSGRRGGDVTAIDKDKTKAHIEALTKEIEEFTSRRARLLDPRIDPAVSAGIMRATDALKDQMTTWGLVGDAAKRAQLVATGATDLMLKGYDEASAKLTKMKEAEADVLASMARPLTRSTSPFMDEIKRVMGTSKLSDWTWMEKGSGKFGMLGGLLSMGVNSVGDALKPILEDSKKLHPTLAGAVEAGSKEGYSLSMKNQFGNETGDKLVDIKKAIVDGTKQMTDLLRAIGIVI